LETRYPVGLRPTATGPSQCSPRAGAAALYQNVKQRKKP
jgi:hypothetical protein